MDTTGGAAADLVVVHTSDLHLGGRWQQGSELWALRAVLDASTEAGAQALIMAGDVFDSHRTPVALLERAARMLADAALEVVILPGNDDPATPDAVYRHSGMDSIANVHVMGVTVRIRWSSGARAGSGGRAAHGVRRYVAAGGAAGEVGPRGRFRAHGHWVKGPTTRIAAGISTITRSRASGADYVALGHWDVPQPAGDGSVPAFYSGSPEVARTLNVVRFGAAGVEVRRQALRLDA